MSLSKRPKPTFIFVRHGQSITNKYKWMRKRICDPQVMLTTLGHQQAQQAADFLAGYLPRQLNPRPKKVRVMRSDYVRAIQTAEPIIDVLGKLADFTPIEVRDLGRLRELEFGYVGHFDGDLPEHVRWMTHILRYQGYKYYDRRYGGEAPADVEVRARLALDAMYRDFEQGKADTFIVPTHGLTLRVLVRALIGYDNAWYEKEPNPDNCAIRVVTGGEDLGYVFPNSKGQWDPDWVDEPEDLDRLNQQGQFFSQTELRDMQAHPELAEAAAEFLHHRKTAPAGEALKIIRPAT